MDCTCILSVCRTLWNVFFGSLCSDNFCQLFLFHVSTTSCRDFILLTFWPASVRNVWLRHFTPATSYTCDIWLYLLAIGHFACPSTCFTRVLYVSVTGYVVKQYDGHVGLSLVLRSLSLCHIKLLECNGGVLCCRVCVCLM